MSNATNSLSGSALGTATLNINGDMSGMVTELRQAETHVKSSMAGMASKASTAMIGVGGAITGAFAVGARAAMDFGHGMANVSTLGVKDLKGLETGVKSVARTFGTDLNDTAEQMYQTISAGIPEDAAIMVLETAARGAAAAHGELSSAVDMGTSVLNAYGKNAGSAVEINKNFTDVMGMAATAVKLGKTTLDEMGGSLGRVAPLANSAGVSMGEMYASIAALTSGGIQTTEAVSGLKQVLANIVKPGSEAAQVASDLGIQFDATTLKSMGLAGFLDMVKNSTGGNVETMAQLFGSVEAVNTVLSLTGAQAGMFTKALGEMDNAQQNFITMSDAMIRNDPSLAYKQFTAELRILAIELGQAVLPVMKDFIGVITPIVQKLAAVDPHIMQLVFGFGAASLALGMLIKIAMPFLTILNVMGGGLSAISGAAGLGGVAASAPLAAGAIAAMGALGVVALGGLAMAAHAAYKAHEELANVNKNVDESLLKLKSTLRQNNIEWDESKLAAMDSGQAIGYLTGLYNAHVQAVKQGTSDTAAGHTEAQKSVSDSLQIMDWNWKYFANSQQGYVKDCVAALQELQQAQAMAAMGPIGPMPGGAPPMGNGGQAMTFGGGGGVSMSGTSINVVVNGSSSPEATGAAAANAISRGLAKGVRAKLRAMGYA